MQHQIKWDQDIVWVEGNPCRLGTMSPVGETPVRVKCDLYKLNELHRGGKPVDEAISLHRMS